MKHSIFKFLAATSISVMMGLPAYACVGCNPDLEFNKDLVEVTSKNYDEHYAKAYHLTVQEMIEKNHTKSLATCTARLEAKEPYDHSKEGHRVVGFIEPSERNLSFSIEDLGQKYQIIKASNNVLRRKLIACDNTHFALGQGWIEG